MAQKVQTYYLPFNKGGFNANPNLDLIGPESFVDGSRNINLQNGGREKRGGTSLLSGTPITGTPRIMGLFDFTLQSGSQFIVFGANDGNVYKNVTTTIKTGMSSTNKFWFMNLKDVLYICDGATRPQTWNGVAASTSNITSIPSDWTGSNFPKYMFVHSTGAAHRGVAFGTPSFLETVYLSNTNDGQDYSDANVVKIVIPTGDGFGLVGGIEFGENAIMFSKRKAFILNTLDSSTANWGYQVAQWEGGVAHNRLLVRTPNDVIAMTEDGEIYSITAVQQFGDYQAASIARPSFIHRWIADNVDLSKIDDFHAVYDPSIRAVKIFVVRNGVSMVDTALLFYVDRSPEEAWTIKDNQVSNSGYRASASAIVRVSAGLYNTYTGGYSGEIWKLEQLARTDNSAAYQTAIRTPQLSFDQPRFMKLYIGGRLTVIPKGDYNITVKWWVDGVAQTDRTVSTLGQGGVYGSAIYGSSYFGGQELVDPVFELGQIGKRIQYQLENNNASEDFFISALYTDFKYIGNMPD